MKMRKGTWADSRRRIENQKSYSVLSEVRRLGKKFKFEMHGDLK